MTDHEWLPWKIHPGLTKERLQIIAGIITQVREETLGFHQPTKGDNSWTLGCTTYARVCHAITQAALDDYPSWLSVVDDTGLHFVFSIGSVPCRFYKGDPRRIPLRTLRQRYPELQHLQKAFRFMDSPAYDDKLFRFAVETDASGRVQMVTLVQTNRTGKIASVYRIRLEEDPVIYFPSTRKEPVDIPEPSVGSRKNTKKIKNED